MTASELAAVIFDVDGTLADTERDGHRHAFNEAFAAHGLDITWDAGEYGELLRITGGARRIAADLRARGLGDGADEVAAAVHDTKTTLFRERVIAGAIMPRPGLTSLVRSLAREGIRIAVATTGRRTWVEPLVSDLLGDAAVETIVTGDDVGSLKPDPEAYLCALERLGLSAESALAVEDSEVGLRSAVGAGLATIVVTNDYTAEQDFASAAMVRSSFDKPRPLDVADCRRVHRQWWSAR